jgi:Fic family protein
MDATKEIQIKEERGLWKASSYVHKIAKRLVRKNEPVRLRYIQEAHRILFSETNEKDVAGKYRKNDPTITRVDGTDLDVPNWTKVGEQMAILDEELKAKTSQLAYPSTGKEYAKIIDLAIKTSHRLTQIHPFHNGNGRMSRLLINFVLARASLPFIAIKEDKPMYLNSMLQADKFDIGPLRRLILKGLIEVQNKKVQTQESLSLSKSKKQKSLLPRRHDFK